MDLHLPSQRLLVCSLMLLPAIVSRPQADAGLDVAGSIALTASPSTGPATDASGRAAFIGTSKGKNQSTGAAEFMNGAAVATADTASLVNGTGPHHGSITMSEGTDQVVFAWKGHVTTVMGADKTPRSTFAGTWTVRGASGRHAGAKGSGRYTGRFTSGTESVIDWEGTIDR
jgi:hypothetical protein